MKRRERVRLSLLSAGCAIALAACGAGATQGSTKTTTGSSGSGNYPTRPITMIVPQAAGSASDVLARTFARGLGSQLHQSVVVKDAPGGSGAVGIAAMESAAADGYTLYFPSESMLYGLAQHLSPYKLSDMDFLAQLVQYPMGLYVSAQSPYKTMKAFVNYAKSHPNALSVSASGAVSAGEQIVAGLDSAYGIKLNYVAVKGGNAAALAVLSGQSTAGSGVLSNAIPYVKAGKMRVIFLSSKSSDPKFPNSVTASSLKISDVVGNWLGLVVKHGVPQAVRNKLVSAAETVSRSSQWQDLLAKKGITSAWAGPSAFASEVSQVYPQIATYVSSSAKTKG